MSPVVIGLCATDILPFIAVSLSGVRVRSCTAGERPLDGMAA